MGDFSMNILCVIAFVIPLYKVLRSVRGSTTMSYDMTLNMKHVGIKVTLLTLVSCLTTLIGLILYTLFTFGHVFPYDWAINSVCLILMTPYYPDHKYYHRLCGLCIKCCFRIYKNVALQLKQQQSTNSATTTNAATIDTTTTEPASSNLSVGSGNNGTIATKSDSTAAEEETENMIQVQTDIK